MRSRLISWKTFDDEQFRIRWQMDFVDEQIFTFLPFEVVIRELIIEGRQSSFLSG
jgi:hypothetical protein